MSQERGDSVKGSASDATLGAQGRVQIVNVWRPIKGPLLDAPLAVCDAASINANDLVPSDLVNPHRVGETYSVTYRPVAPMVLFSQHAD